MRNGPSSSTTPSIPGRRGSISRPLKKQFPSKFIAFFRIVSQACAVLVGLPALFALSAAAQPANDDFANAQLIPVDQPLPIITTTSTLGATIEAAETALDPSLAASVWFKVTSPVDDLVQLDTFGSDFQTRLVVGVGSSLATLDVASACSAISSVCSSTH